MLKTFAREIVAKCAISAPDFYSLPAAAARTAHARWQEMVERAVLDSVERIVEPAGALAREAAPGEVPHAISSVVRRLRVASPFEYFPEIVEQYAGRKGISEMTGASLSSLLHRIDRRMTEGFTANEWVSLSEPLFELGQSHPSGAVPAGVVRRFLTVRGADDLANTISERNPLSIEDFGRLLGATRLPTAPDEEDKPATEEASKIPFPVGPSGDGVSGVEPELGPEDEPTLGQILSDSEVDITTEETASPPPFPAKTGGNGHPASDTDVIEDDSDAGTSVPIWRRFLGDDHPEENPVDEPAESTDGVPLWKRFFQPQSEDDEVEEPTPPDELPVSIEPEAAVEEPDSVAEPVVVEESEPDFEEEPEEFEAFWHVLSENDAEERSAEPIGAQADATESDIAEPETLESLEEHVLGEAADEWRTLYVDTLFKGKEEEYERVLGELRLALDWQAASDIIAKEVFKKNKVDIYAVPAVAFTDAVEAQYKGEDSVD